MLHRQNFLKGAFCEQIFSWMKISLHRTFPQPDISQTEVSPTNDSSTKIIWKEISRDWHSPRLTFISKLLLLHIGLYQKGLIILILWMLALERKAEILFVYIQNPSKTNFVLTANLWPKATKPSFFWEPLGKFSVVCNICFSLNVNALDVNIHWISKDITNFSSLPTN